MATSIIRVKFETAIIPEEPLLTDKSWMISGAAAHDDLIGYCFLAPGIRKDKSLGVHFADLSPLPNNRFQIEIGTALPDLFPNIGGQSEYSLPVQNGHSSRELCVSNVMAKLRFEKNGDASHAIVSQRAIKRVRDGKIAFIPQDASVELLRTFVTCRFDIEGATAEEAFESHAEACIFDLIERLNRVLKILPFCDVSGQVFSTAYSRASISQFFFIIKGATDKLGHGWLAPHVGRSSLAPLALSREKSQLLRDYAAGILKLDEIDALLHSAQSFLDGGVTEYVLLLSVIAAEVATQRFVIARLQEKGISKSKIATYEKDITYSMMLNIMLPALVAGNYAIDNELIGKMNRARSLRNEYMHTGSVPPKESEVSELFAATKKFVAFLRKVENSGPTPPL